MGKDGAGDMGGRCGKVVNRVGVEKGWIGKLKVREGEEGRIVGEWIRKRSWGKGLEWLILL